MGEKVAFPGRRHVEEAIKAAENPTGMQLNDGKERVTLPGGTLRYMLRIIDDAADTKRLNAIAENYWTLDSFAMPTGQGDADVGWSVAQYHEGDALPRTVAEVFKDDPRAAIDAAIASDSSSHVKEE